MLPPAVSCQASPKRTPARANPPARPIGVPSARQHAAPVSEPLSWNWIAFMPPATVGTTSRRIGKAGMLCYKTPRGAYLVVRVIAR